ncbi:MAG: metallophosphoesterase [Bacteroidota bacterium]
MKKIFYLPGISLLILLACNQPVKVADQNKKDEFTFAFLTDIHLQPERSAVEGFQKAIDTINRINPDFVLTGGDLVMDALNQTYGRADSLYKLYETVTKGFNMPVYNTVGNHEVYGWHRDEAGLEEHPEFGKGMFEKRFGKRYYSFNHKGWHFIILDAIYRSVEGQYEGMIDDEQISWIREDLQKTGKETPIVVSVHIPFITSQTQLTRGSLEPNSRGLVIVNSREVLLHFWEYNLKLVLQGHLHFLEDINVNNQVHFITGGAVCGKWWNNKPEDPMEEGFLLVHMNGEEFDWEYVDYGWTPPNE